jgi:hypothetical protein
VGLEWKYQLDPSLHKIIQKELSDHFAHFLEGKRDKNEVPLYLFLAGAGTGKSRNATEFHNTLIQSSPVQSDLRRRLNDAVVFHVSFENGTSLRHQERSNPMDAIAHRMLHQLLGGTLDSILTRYIAPSAVTVFELVAKARGVNFKDLAGVLIVDGMQYFARRAADGQDKESVFYTALQGIADVAMQGALIIPCCTATVAGPITAFLAASHQKRVYLPVCPLEPPTIPRNGEEDPVFTDDRMVKLLVADCGGHGRALECLARAMRRGLADGNVSDIMQEVRIDLRDRYMEAISYLDFTSFAAVARVILLQQYVTADKCIPGTEHRPDDVASVGLIRFERDSTRTGGFLTAPYIWLWLFTSLSDKHDEILGRWRFDDYGEHEGKWDKTLTPDARTWQNFEHFVARVRVLKSTVVGDNTTTTISQVHAGARLNGDLAFTNHSLRLQSAVHREKTNSSSRSGRIWKVDCDRENVNVWDFKHCIINGTSASSGDIFLGLDVAGNRPPVTEVEQCKAYTVAHVTAPQFLAEREKSASADDFFLVYTMDEKCSFDLPHNSGIVDGNNWSAYFGPFAGRAYIFANPGPMDINTATRTMLNAMTNIGAVRVSRVLEQRSKKRFRTYDDIESRAKIPKTLAQRFKDPSK